MNRPTKIELLQAVQGFLDELVGDLEGVKRFHARVASNAVSIVARELELGREMLTGHHERLGALLQGETQSLPEDEAELALLVETLEAELAERIRAGEGDAGPWREQLLAHLRASARERLAISNPGYR
jgi:hypothetical protein